MTVIRGACPRPQRKSIRSGNTNCVGVRLCACCPAEIGDTKDPAGQPLRVSPAAFRAFTAGVRSGLIVG